MLALIQRPSDGTISGSIGLGVHEPVLVRWRRFFPESGPADVDADCHSDRNRCLDRYGNQDCDADGTSTAMATATVTRTATSTATASPTSTPTPTATATVTATASSTATATAPATATETPTPTATPTQVPKKLRVNPRRKIL